MKGNKKKNILIIANLFGNNRQGYDMANALRRLGHCVRLVQFSNETDRQTGNYGVGFIRPHGPFSKFMVLENLFRIVNASLFCRKEIVICIGAQLLPIAVFYKYLFRAEIVYYSLEYVHYSGFARYIVNHCVDKYIDVEENRLARVLNENELSIPTVTLYNLPALLSNVTHGGLLRSYLREHHGFSGNEKILIYAGSYQRYACIENLVKASAQFRHDVYLVLMVAWGLPSQIEGLSNQCIVVPPQGGEVFYSWLSDADYALLPYEDPSDFNVENCSPQKLFDCYLVGVRYLASNRPIIRKTLAVLPEAGMLCDFTNVQSIVSTVGSIEFKDTENIRASMRRLYREKFNYNIYDNVIGKFIVGGM